MEENTSMNHLLHQPAHHLRAAEKVVVLTGAGTSAESGIPTFRDVMTGLWAKYKPYRSACPSVKIHG